MTTKKEYLRACKEWRRLVRLSLYHEYHKKACELVSDNEVYELLFVKHKVSAPPAWPGARDGLPRSLIFVDRETDEPYYEPTGKMIRSIDPVARGRRIRVYRYVPFKDTRQVGLGVVSGSTGWLNDWSGSL